jgi:large subunit ribosomal protein L5
MAINSRLQKKYQAEVVPALVKKFNYTSTMQVPRLEKIVVNIGVGDASSNAKFIEDSVKELTQITGQKPVITKAKKSIATFKIREGMNIGCKVTLRGQRMFDFYDKLISIALPRTRDFRGISKTGFDGRGNYTLGVREQLIFPEINYEQVSRVRGMDVIIVTTAKSDEEARELLAALGTPFAK